MARKNRRDDSHRRIRQRKARSEFADTLTELYGSDTEKVTVWLEEANAVNDTLAKAKAA